MKLLDRLEEILIGTLIMVATLLIFVAVVHRYSLSMIAWGFSTARAHEWESTADAIKAVYLAVRSINLIWAQELCIILFVWMAKFGAAYGVRTGIHVGIDVVINRLSTPYRRLFILIGLLSGAFFTGVVATLGTNFVWHMAHTEATAADMEVPMWLIYLAIPLGSSLMSFRFLQVAYNFARGGELPHHDHGHVDGLEEEGAK